MKVHSIVLIYKQCKQTAVFKFKKDDRNVNNTKSV